MPNYCSVYGCYLSSSKNPDLSFYRFPKDAKLLKAWVCRVRRENFTPSSTSYVCSRHFNETEMYIPATDTPTVFKKRRLRPGAIPSVNLRGAIEDEQLTRRSRRPTSGVDVEPEVVAEATNVAQGLEGSERSLMGAGPLLTNEPSSSTIEPKGYDVQELLKRIEALEKKRFCFENLNASNIKNYTGIDKSIFQVIANTIKKFSPLNYWSGFQVKSISLEDQLLIFLMRLRLDLPYYDLAIRYSVSETTIQNIIMTYLHALHEIFFVGMMKDLPSQEKNKCSLPGSFEGITNCRIIIDCTEFRIAAPRKDLAAASVSYSNYKHYLSAKYLIGVAPNGAITFVSHGFPGSTSDKSITNESGVISHLKVTLKLCCLIKILIEIEK